MGIEHNQPASHTDPSSDNGLTAYEIHVKGFIDEVFWSDWFGDMAFTIDPVQKETVLSARIVDQAELYGLLSRLRNKGLTLVSVQQIHA